MNKLVLAQHAGEHILRFLITLSLRGDTRSQYHAGVYDNFLFEYFRGVLTVTTMAGDVELGYTTYSKHDNTPSIAESIGMEGFDTSFHPDVIQILYDAFDTLDLRDCQISCRHIRGSANKGALELAVKRLGTIYIEYVIITRDTGTGIQVLRTSAVFSPRVRPRTAVHTV